MGAPSFILLLLLTYYSCSAIAQNQPRQHLQQQQQQQQQHQQQPQLHSSDVFGRLAWVEAMVKTLSKVALELQFDLWEFKDVMNATVAVVSKVNNDTLSSKTKMTTLKKDFKLKMGDVGNSMAQLRDNFTEIERFVSESSPPLGTIVPWTNRPKMGFSGMILPAGWQLCDGSVITSGPWQGHLTPDLNGKELFVRGSAKFKDVLTEEEEEEHSERPREEEEEGHERRWTRPRSMKLLYIIKTSSSDRRKEKDDRAPTLLLVGGQSRWLYSDTGSAELIDVGGSACPEVAAYPGSGYGMTGAFINNRAMVCGGQRPTLDGQEYFTRYVAECYVYDFPSATWTQVSSMLQRRSFSASVQLSPTTWWITGGENDDNDGEIGPISSTEIFDSSIGNFSAYVDLPEKLNSHHLLKVNDTHVMLVGEFRPGNQAWMFRLSDRTWHRLPELPVGTKGICVGLVKKPEGEFEVVVVAGRETQAEWNTTWVQIFSSDTQTWRRAKDFPVANLMYSRCVTHDSTFLVIGAEFDGVAQDSIWSYDAGKETFNLLPPKVQVGRDIFAAILVPSGFAQCVPRV